MKRFKIFDSTVEPIKTGLKLERKYKFRIKRVEDEEE